LGERHRFEHGFPLIRSLRTSGRRSTSVLFSFVLSLLIMAGAFAIRQSKTIPLCKLNHPSRADPFSCSCVSAFAVAMAIRSVAMQISVTQEIRLVARLSLTSRRQFFQTERRGMARQIEK
jgi:undecaprenyl pyrophosphate phosphatase UppP